MADSFSHPLSPDQVRGRLLHPLPWREVVEARFIVPSRGAGHEGTARRARRVALVAERMARKGILDSRLLGNDRVGGG